MKSINSSLETLKEEIYIIETRMSDPDFWEDKNVANLHLRDYQDKKQEIANLESVEKSSVTMSIYAGAGGDDAEDWVRILLEMYIKFAINKKYEVNYIAESKNENGGYRNICFEINGKNAYRILKNETGVHRLVRNSPFNSKGLRQTSFAYVEVLPILPYTYEFNFDIKDLEFSFTRSGGAGGQNVNKRETAVYATHIPTDIKVRVETERSQEKNKQTAIELIKSKLYTLEEEKKERQRQGLSGDFKKGTDIEWGSQIRSYTLHPYKLIKDHRNNMETSDIDDVLYKGNLDLFLNL